MARMHRLDRRRFLQLSALGLAGGSSLLAACQTPGRRVAATEAAKAAKGEKLRLGIVGVANQGGANLGQVEGESIVALCDVDSAYLEAAGNRFPSAKRYRDFRELLSDDTLDLAGVVISTPDHTHAPAAAMALRRGLGVYLEKPLTHTLEECQLLARLAAENECVTQMGTLIHAGANYRRVVEAIQAGVIGRVTQIDCWCPKSWCCAKPTPGAKPPPQLDWALWQGPIPEAEYVEGLTPANWRRHWSYGTGTLGDMGCHILDLPMWALGLDGPRGQRCVVTADGPPVDAIGCPEWLEATWVFPDAYRDLPNGSRYDPLILRWFDGGRVPPTVQELGGKERQDYFGRYMVCFQGTTGFLMANYGEMKVLQNPDVTMPPPSIPDSIGHHQEWLEAMRHGKATGAGSPLCRFDYASRLTELVLLGTVAYRSGKPLEWDRAKGGGSPAQRALFSETYRPGWRL